MRRTLTLLRCALVCLGTIAPLAQTFADPVAVTIVQGSIVVVERPNRLGLIDIRGTEGFHWEGSFENFSTWGESCPCGAGQTLAFSTVASVPWTGSTVRHRGETHTSFTFFDSYGRLQLTGPEFVLPLAPGAARVTFQAPFTLEGEFGYLGPGASMVWSLMGAGVATAVYDFVSFDAGEGQTGHFYEFRSLTYDFRQPNAPSDPVPEPATLSLVGAGACAAAFNRWRRRRSPRVPPTIGRGAASGAVGG